MKKALVEPCAPQGDKQLDELIALYEETLGFCPNSVRTMYHRPEIAYSFIALNKAVMQNKGRITSALKRLVAYISSHATGCRYCQAHTIRAAERYGAEAEQLAHIWEFEEHPAFSQAERVALRFALRSSMVPNQVDEELAEALRQHWDAGEIVELTGVIALFGFLNRWNDSMATELEDPARESAEHLLAKDAWTVGKHG